MQQPQWLEWAKQIQAISQAGLAYSKDMYDLERFEQLRSLSIVIMQHYTEVDEARIRELFASETGYQTPKVDIRGVIFNDMNEMLLVREKQDGAWALPGGWADVGLSARENVVKEVREEAGLDVRTVRLLGLVDKKFHAHPPSPFHVYKLFVLCEVVGGRAEAGMETFEVGYFGEDGLPPLSPERNTAEQLGALFARYRNSQLPMLFD